MFQNLSLLAVHLRQSDSDSAEETEGEDEVSFRSVIYLLAAYGSLQNQLFMKSHREFLVSYICHIELIIYIRKFTILNIFG